MSIAASNSAGEADDEFARLLLEEAKRFREKAQEAPDAIAQDAYRHASLLLAFSALEAHVNGVAEELLLRGGFDVMEEGLLREQDVRLKQGKWELTGKLKMYRLEDRLLFLFARTSSVTTLASFSWWPHLRNAMSARNALVHPRASLKLTEKDVDRYVISVVDCLDALYRAVFGKSHPASKRAATSTLEF